MSLQEIAKSIADELREHPERWIKGSYARAANGRAVSSTAKEACSWCLIGMVYRNCWETRRAQAFAVERLLSDIAGDCIEEWNDVPNRTVADVIALLDQAAAS